MDASGILKMDGVQMRAIMGRIGVTEGSSFIIGTIFIQL